MSFLPSREADLLTWSTNFNQKIAVRYADYGLSQSQSTEYAQTHATFANAYAVANDPETRTTPNIVAKNDAKIVLRSAARQLAGIVQKHPGTTNQMRSDLGLTVPDLEPTPVPPPADPPVLTVASTMGKTVKMRLRDLHNQDKRARPVGVTGAAVFSYVGAVPPPDIKDWKFEFNTSKTTVNIHFPPALSAGTQVWMTAFWFNLKKQSGPAAAPITTTLSGAISLAA